MTFSFNNSLSNSGSSRSDVRSINKDNGIVMVGQNLAMMKIEFQDWKNIFKDEI